MNYNRSVVEAAVVIPHGLICNHPQLVRLRAEKADADAQQKIEFDRVMAGKNLIVRLENSLERLKGERSTLQAQLPSLATQAIDTGDPTFAKAVAARAEIQRIGWEQEARADAIAELRRRPQTVSPSTAQRGTTLDAELAAFEKQLRLDIAFAAWSNNPSKMPGDWPERGDAYRFASQRTG